MAVRLKLKDGTEILVQASLDELANALQAASTTGAVLKIEQPNGRMMAITPQAVETILEEPGAGRALDDRFAEAAGAR